MKEKLCNLFSITPGQSSWSFDPKSYTGQEN